MAPSKGAVLDRGISTILDVVDASYGNREICKNPMYGEDRLKYGRNAL
jgi:hypothetical protein